MALVALRDQADLAGPGALSPAPRRPARPRSSRVHKFRSMRQDAEAATGPVWAAKDGDPRVTPIGRFLRRTPPRRAAAALERAEGRHELRRPAPRAAGVRHRAHASRFRSTASATSSGPASPAGRRSATPTARASRTRCRSCSTTCSTSRTCRSRSTSSSSSRRSRRSFCGRAPRSCSAAAALRRVACRQRDEHRRGGLLPRQRVRRHRAADRSGTRMESRVVREHRRRLLDIFDEFGVREHVLRARLGRRAASRARADDRARGHEVASHGYAHRLVYDQTPAAFRDDVRRAKQLLEDACGRRRRRLPGAELFDHAALAVGARRAARGRLRVRLQHLSDPPRSLRHSGVGPAPVSSSSAESADSSRCRARRRSSGR